MLVREIAELPIVSFARILVPYTSGLGFRPVYLG